MKILVATISVILLSAMQLGAAALPHELYGFLLKQNRKTFESVLGKPFESRKADDGSIAAFTIPRTKDSYIAVTFNKHEEATSIQLTGTDYKGSTGFFGLTLGDDPAKVEAALGKPSETRREEAEKLDLWDYAPRNFTLEFNASRKLYSIQVFAEDPDDPKTHAGMKEAREFAAAITAGNVETLLRMSSGSLVCGPTSNSLTFGGPARTELTGRSGKMMDCLGRAAAAIAKDASQDEMRVSESAILGVTKYPANSPLRELVFIWEVNDWRIWEVTFR
jgi:hypothetical protein